MNRQTKIALGLLLGSFGLKIILLALFPMVYGGDTVGRILHKDQIHFSVWLPGLQTLIYLATRISDSLFFLRSIMALVSTLAAAALYEFSKKVYDRSTALWSLFFFLFSPIALYLSLVPYQEMLFLLFALLALVLYGQETSLRRMLLSSLMLGLACLTRYEGWVLAVILSFAYLKDRFVSKTSWEGSLGRRVLHWSFGATLGLLLFGWAPILVLLSGWYSAPEQNPHLLTASAFETAPQFAAFYIAKMAVWSNPLLLLIIGATVLVGHGQQLVPPTLSGKNSLTIYLSFAFVIAFTVFLFVSDDSRYNSRFVFLPSIIVSLFIGRVASLISPRVHSQNEVPFGFSAVVNRVFVRAFLLATIGIGIYPIPVISGKPEIRTPYEVASFLNGRLTESDRALVLCQLWQDHPEIFPLDYTRLVAQSNFDTTKILSPIRVRDVKNVEVFLRNSRIRYLIVFSNFWKEPKYLEDIRDYLQSHAEAFRTVQDWNEASIFEYAPLSLEDSDLSRVASGDQRLCSEVDIRRMEVLDPLERYQL